MGKLYTCEEVAGTISRQGGTVLAWIRDKKLCAISISGSKMYRVAEEGFDCVRECAKDHSAERVKGR